MYPIVGTVWGVPIASWYFMVCCSLFASYFYGLYLCRIHNFTQASRYFDMLFIGGVTSGWLGARGLSIVVEQLNVTSFFQGLIELVKPGPLTFYGGVLGGAIFLLCVGCLCLNIPVKHIVLCASPPLILGLSIGRIGCLLNGDDYGAPVPQGPSFWTLTFPNLNDGLPRYPVQIEETLANGMLLFFYHKLLKKYPKKKYFLSLFLLEASAINRFFLEFYRGDHRGAFFHTQLSTSQGIAILIIVVCQILIVFDSVKNRDECSLA